MRTRIELLRIKDRFAQPTSGGWADVLINFTFVAGDKGDKSFAKHNLHLHVVELQVSATGCLSPDSHCHLHVRVHTRARLRHVRVCMCA